jgi:hypothetical protein
LRAVRVPEPEAVKLMSRTRRLCCGRPSDPAPLSEHRLAPGSYVVSVRREGYVTVVDTVEITSGNVTRRNVVLVRN